MQEKENKRLLYTAKDLQDITGFCPVKCREEIAKMRRYFKLQDHEYFTVFHASQYMNITLEELLRRMRP